MPELQGLAFFPGVQQVMSAQYTLSHGITPGVCTLEIAPQPNFEAAGGPLVFAFGGVQLVFPDCKVNSHALRRNSRGEVWSLAIFDRRWKWAFGKISGVYNARLENGELDPRFEKRPTELAQLCLDAMGEANADLGGLAMLDNARPVADWEHDNPAQALADLAEELGCRVVLGLDNGVHVCRTGVGSDLPLDNEIIANSLTIDPPERPDSILVVCDKTRYQVDFLLEAVGVDTDGSIKLIDDLSYKPAKGWKYEDPTDFANVGSGIYAYERFLALKYVYRWYRISLTGTDNQPLRVYDANGTPQAIADRRQVLPLESVQVDTFTFTIDGTQAKKPLPAMVWGIFYPGGLGLPPNTTSGNNIDGNILPDPATKVPAVNSAYYQGAFRIHESLGIVAFADAVVRFDTDGTYLPGLLALRCACSVRDGTTWAYDRYEREVTYTGGRWGTGPKVLKHDEIVLTVAPKYGAYPTVIGVVTNRQDVDREADYYLQAADLAYQTPLPQHITYAGLKPLSPDGAIVQVSWTVGLSGATTQASRTNEFSVVTPPYNERRMIERLQRAF